MSHPHPSFPNQRSLRQALQGQNHPLGQLWRDEAGLLIDENSAFIHIYTPLYQLWHSQVLRKKFPLLAEAAGLAMWQRKGHKNLFVLGELFVRQGNSPLVAACLALKALAKFATPPLEPRCLLLETVYLPEVSPLLDSNSVLNGIVVSTTPLGGPATPLDNSSFLLSSPLHPAGLAVSLWWTPQERLIRGVGIVPFGFQFLPQSLEEVEGLLMGRTLSPSLLNYVASFLKEQLLQISLHRQSQKTVTHLVSQFQQHLSYHLDRTHTYE